MGRSSPACTFEKLLNDGPLGILAPVTCGYLLVEVGTALIAASELLLDLFETFSPRDPGRCQGRPAQVAYFETFLYSR